MSPAADSVVLKPWDSGSFKADDWTTWDMDLTPYCADAGQYEVDFFGIGGSGVEIRSLTLVHGGIEAAELVRPTARRNAYKVNITGVGGAFALRAVVRMMVSQRGSHGQVTIRRAP